MKLSAIPKSVRRALWAVPVLAMVSAGAFVANVAEASANRADDHAHHALEGKKFVPVAAATNDIARARQATAPFHDINVAKSSGYPSDVTGCVSAPDGNGAMGHHFLNPTLENDGGAVDVTKPEALVYEPQADGSFELVALEYIVPFADRPGDGPAPVLFGRNFDNTPTAEAWTLHAWVWRDNPSGMHAPFNPNVSCG